MPTRCSRRARRRRWIWSPSAPAPLSWRNIRKTPASCSPPSRTTGREIEAGSAGVYHYAGCVGPFCQNRENECQVMPFPNPADLPRMKANKDINLMSKAGLNTGFRRQYPEAPLNNVKVRRRWRWPSTNRPLLTPCSTALARRRRTCCRRGYGADSELKDYEYDPEKPKRC